MMHNWLYKFFTSGQNDDLDETTKRLIRFFFYFCTVIVIFILCLLAINFIGHEKSTTPYLGSFGDFFGGVLNPILGFFTVIGLSITVVMQRISLKASRLLAFETTFFNMLELHNNIVQQLRFDPSIIRSFSEESTNVTLAQKKTRFFESIISLTSLLSVVSNRHYIHEGRAVFSEILKSLDRATGQVRDFGEVYKHDLQEKHNYVLGHYFRNLYQILKHISRGERSVLTAEQAKEYSAIVRSQLSSHELALLLLNCGPTVVDNGGFLNLVVRYRILEHLPLKTSHNARSLNLLEYSINKNNIEQYFTKRKLTNGEAIRKNRSWVILPGAYGTNPSVQKFLTELQPELSPYDEDINSKIPELPFLHGDI